jgi:hypothetical protein
MKQKLNSMVFIGGFVISDNDVRLPDYRNAFLIGDETGDSGYVHERKTNNIR